MMCKLFCSGFALRNSWVGKCVPHDNIRMTKSSINEPVTFLITAEWKKPLKICTASKAHWGIQLGN